MIKKSLALLLSIEILASPNAWADLSIADFENKGKTQSTNTYLLGLSSGLNATNKALIAKKQVPLYCYPPYLNLTIADYREIIFTGIKELDDNPVKPSVDDILLQKLSKLYPCGYN
ncbi:hypothetical protein [Polynucleobacter sp. MWH-UH2A]|jgi:hypothetical protein|uniref:hypothetical protein n=1 Tax=Polynucleobacter sp. MWH-UH2A TaxID=1855617 RepID=UPI001BFE48C5|nr:hypothetical protein [Polynucleobacter sp. MWH-UH2A]QWD64677.1 hypothetical protein IC571_03330 [Polynucleobacter sp. MWH-UH2A]